MSSNDDRRQQRIDILEGHVTDEHLESIKNGGSEEEEDAGCTTDVDVAEALSNYGSATLDDVDEMEAEIGRLEKKLEALGSALPDDRTTEVREQLEALEAATEAHSPVRTNTAEALASRIGVRDR